MNVIARLEYELAYYDSAVNRFNHYTTRTPPAVLFRTNPGSINPQRSSYTATCLQFHAGWSNTWSLVWADQQRLIYINSERILNTVLKNYLEQRAIGMGGKTESRDSVLSAQSDEDDDSYNIFYKLQWLDIIRHQWKQYEEFRVILFNVLSGNSPFLGWF